MMYVPLEQFRTLDATHIVGLGKDCATAYNVRRHFNFGGAFPFDWWVTSEGQGIAKFLDNPEVESLYDLSCLELTPSATSVRNKKFGFLFHHEFPRHWSAEGSPIREDWQESIAVPKQRTAALVGKLVNLNQLDKRIVFIRNGNAPQPLLDSLEKLLPLPCWTFVQLDVPQTDIAGPEGWKGDLDVWERLLNALEIKLDRSGHRPFAEAKNEPTQESLCA